MVMMYHLTLTIIEPLKQSLKRIKDIKKLHVNKADNIFRPTSKLFDRERGREERERESFSAITVIVLYLHFQCFCLSYLYK